MNTTSLIKHHKPLFYSCKYKYKTNKKNTSSKPLGPIFESENIPRIATLILFSFEKFFFLINLLSFQSLGHLRVKPLNLYT